ncbi:M48 family metallopeptidase [Curvibacter sp. APW13]|uniref:M48 family metallopeptidase n=1 Tax=Curvibacter sp. APW13 TaxID=3077236 RepID=UPI0028DF52E3|nr:M48 family metallopeptidase [Curvibacter sp. APW13]MDT8990280.1 M48 family metallopeptidase [Curvibacter sp. APW13]
MPQSPHALPALYFDGRQARPHPVELWLRDGVLHVRGEGVALQVPERSIEWPERTRHGGRTATFAEGGMVQALDAGEWDAWVQASGRQEGWVVRAQQNWRSVAAFSVVLVALLVALQQWGLPWAAQGLARLVPASVEAAVGESTLSTLDAQLMEPSAMDATQQARLQDALRQVLPPASPGESPAWQVVFRKSRIGPNALALPGGTIIVTDELVELVDQDVSVLAGVAAHEWGHVRHQHGMRMLLQATVLGAVWTVMFGDTSGLLASVPLLLGQAQYSRQAEREADEAAVQVLRRAKISPDVMVRFFDKLAAHRKRQDQAGQDDWGSRIGIAFSSHPSDAERVAFFQAAAAQPLPSTP